MIIRTLAAVSLALALTACGTDAMHSVESIFSPSQADQDLSAGIKNYNDGNYPLAAKLLQSSLDGGLARGSDQAKARKHLAFMHCAANRITPCRDQFRLALKADPGFELTPAEIGHPTWGPVYRAVKSGR